ncbi:MAG: HAD family phosphatase [Clostridia bacterium]|nr:HAD family phosphatase [Clostridia bacterium]
MNEKKYRYIVASDLDGTLLMKGEKISPENEAAIREMKDRGICFVPNSGRTFTEMPEALLSNPDIRYYIGADGAAIWDKETNTRTELYMSREDVATVFDLLDGYTTSYTVRHGGISYADIKKNDSEGYEKYRISKLYGMFIDYYVKKVDGFDGFIRSFEGVEMICAFFSDDAEMEECKRRIEALGKFSVASSEPTNIEIFSKNAGKGSALLALADMLGVPHEKTVAVGDSKNDMDMIKKAGISLAMANASDEVKAAASRTVCHYTEHVARYILDNVIE